MAKKKLTFDYQEQLCAIMAREFTPEDELGCTGIFNHAFVALGLAQELYAPGIAICTYAKGRWGMLGHLRTPFEVGKPPEGQIEALMDHNDIFDCLVGGRWNIFMQPGQNRGRLRSRVVMSEKQLKKLADITSQTVKRMEDGR